MKFNLVLCMRKEHIDAVFWKVVRLSCYRKVVEEVVVIDLERPLDRVPRKVLEWGMRKKAHTSPKVDSQLIDELEV